MKSLVHVVAMSALILSAGAALAKETKDPSSCPFRHSSSRFDNNEDNSGIVQLALNKRVSKTIHSSKQNKAISEGGGRH